MKFTIAIATTFALAYMQSAFGLSIDTPMSLVQCQPSLLAWHNGQPPYYLSVIPGGQPTAPALKTFETTSDESRTWTVDIQAGTSITLALKDNTGATVYTDKVTVQPGSDQSCLNGSPTAASVSAPAASGSSSPAAPTAGKTVAANPTAVPGSGAPAPASSAPPAARPSGSQAAVASARPSNGAVRTSVVNGLTGLLAVVGIALF